METENSITLQIWPNYVDSDSYDQSPYYHYLQSHRRMPESWPSESSTYSHYFENSTESDLTREGSNYDHIELNERVRNYHGIRDNNLFHVIRETRQNDITENSQSSSKQSEHENSQ